MVIRTWGCLPSTLAHDDFREDRHDITPPRSIHSGSPMLDSHLSIVPTPKDLDHVGLQKHGQKATQMAIDPTSTHFRAARALGCAVPCHAWGTRWVTSRFARKRFKKKQHSWLDGIQAVEHLCLNGSERSREGHGACVLLPLLVGAKLLGKSRMKDTQGYARNTFNKDHSRLQSLEDQWK